MYDQYAPYIYAAYSVALLSLFGLLVLLARAWWRVQQRKRENS